MKVFEVNSAAVARDEASIPQNKITDKEQGALKKCKASEKGLLTKNKNFPQLPQSFLDICDTPSRFLYHWTKYFFLSATKTTQNRLNFLDAESFRRLQLYSDLKKLIRISSLLPAFARSANILA